MTSRVKCFTLARPAEPRPTPARSYALSPVHHQGSLQRCLLFPTDVDPLDIPFGYYVLSLARLNPPKKLYHP